jgi:hypothetical protein
MESESDVGQSIGKDPECGTARHSASCHISPSDNIVADIVWYPRLKSRAYSTGSCSKHMLGVMVLASPCFNSALQCQRQITTCTLLITFRGLQKLSRNLLVI